MNEHDLVPARRADITSGQSSGWTDAIARCVIEHAANRAPTALSDRLREEWLADLAEHCGPMTRLRFALGCWWAAMQIGDDCSAVSTPVAASPAGDRIMMAPIRRGRPLFSRQMAASESEPLVCEINTTPLIDVLLVLLVTLIITLPMMTQAVRLNLPQAPPRDLAPAEVINLDIDFDGSLLWNGSAVANFAQLEGYFRAEGQKYPQPEIHLRPDPYVKYDVVAKVLAAAQRNQLRQIGFVNNAEFAY
ncbi:MAG TPA: biopolymer transporter ExbD [Steroidobacteraceae bacterium]|nr:biopolymer transporter ExbD [Steroidobacteraceae bacterium]